LPRIVRLAVAAALFASPAVAQERHEAEREAEGRNHLALFVGGTAVDETVRFTLGVDYERQLSERFGVGAIADWALGGEGREFLFAVAGFYHPTSRIWLDLAPGVQRDALEGELEWVVRVGADYEFELRSGWNLSPNVNLDIGPKESLLVFGIELGRRF
jgi:hypothetical protein